MQGCKKKLIFLTLGTIISPLLVQISKVNAGSFGAEIFCTMRDGGNDHESSWDAAYTYIKKQKGGLFKVSPKQAAAQITETVVRDKETFSYCIEYLDKLHPNRQLLRELEEEKERQEKERQDKEMKMKNLERELEEVKEGYSEDLSEDFSEETIDRYSY